MEGPVDITSSEVQQLRPWIKESVVKLQGFVDHDEFLAKAVIDCLENQRPRQKILEQLKLFNLAENSVRELIGNIEQQTKEIREKKKLLRMEKRKYTNISFEGEEENEEEERKKSKRTKETTNLEGLRAMQTGLDATAALALESAKEAEKNNREEKIKKDKERERERSSRDKERDRSSRDKERSSRDKERERDKDKKSSSRHDKDRKKDKEKSRDHRKEHRSSSSSKEKESHHRESSEKSSKNGGVAATTIATPTAPSTVLPQPEDLQAKINSLLSSIAKTQASLQTTPVAQPTLRDTKDKLSLAVEKAKLAAMSTQKIHSQSIKGKDEDRFIPPPLMVDNEGYEVDAQGNRIVSRVAPLPSTLANKRQLQQKLLEEDATQQSIEKSPFYDPRVATSKTSRNKRSFNFVEAGTYIKMGQRLRTKVQLAALNEQSEGSKEDTQVEIPKDQNPNLIALGTKEEQFFKKKIEGAIPDVEWWDQAILSEKEDYSSPILTEKITFYVEHPVLISPPAEAPPPPPQPLKLTKKEQKKLRRITRAEVQKEKQERILLGLEKQPENKVKISNLMRVLGSEAVQDPTQIEREVRKQMAQRMKNHQMRNEERKLTKEQRAEKRRKKHIEDTSVQTHVAVYRINDLRDKRNSVKIDMNARENHLSGCLLLYHGLNIVVVEGGPKGLNRFKKLMLRRIDWNSQGEKEGGELVDGNGSDVPQKESSSNNKCVLVWEGVVLKPNFKNFRFMNIQSEGEARKVLREHSVEHFFDMASSLDVQSSSELLPQHTSLVDT